VLSPVHTGDKVDCCRNWRQIGKKTVADTVDFVAGFGDKLATTWIRQLVTVDVVTNLVDFIASIVDFVASVYGCDVYVGGKVRVLEFIRFFYLEHHGSK